MTEDEITQSAREDAELQTLMEEYNSHARAMQSGVAMEMNFTKDCDPKHLRVGVNAAHVSDAALVDILIEKGVFTRLEYSRALVVRMREERESYEREISARLGRQVILA